MIEDRKVWLSGYRTLWMIVMFDLPVGDSKERRQATRFRNGLLDLGFHMAQFSVYYRLIAGKEAARAMERQIDALMPDGDGHVQTILITDKQYENIRIYRGKQRESQKKREQLNLF